MYELLLQQLQRQMGVPRMVADLPLDPASVNKVEEVLELGRAVLPEIQRLNIPEGISGELQALREALDVVQENLTKAGGLTAFQWQKFVLCLERTEGDLPKSASHKLEEQYGNLIARAEECNKSFGRTVLRVRVYGDREDLDNLKEDLVAEFLNQLEAAQAELATKYGWSRGKTFCCEKSGFNPPPGVVIGAVHDVTEPKLSEDDEALSGLLELVKNGAVKLQFLDPDDAQIRDDLSEDYR